MLADLSLGFCRGTLQATWAAWGGDCCLLGRGRERLGMHSHIYLGLHHICSELPSASATPALWVGPDGMQPRNLSGYFLEACISIP